jgi:hypothetical protein
MNEIAVGVAGPLLVTAVSWVVMSRTFRHNAQRLTSVMIAAFGVKLVFIAAYTSVALKGLDLRPGPFVASFATSFIVLHLAEALCLRRLFAGGLSAR